MARARATLVFTLTSNASCLWAEPDRRMVASGGLRPGECKASFSKSGSFEMSKIGLVSSELNLVIG